MASTDYWVVIIRDTYAGAERIYDTYRSEKDAIKAKNAIDKTLRYYETSFVARRVR